MRRRRRLALSAHKMNMLAVVAEKRQLRERLKVAREAIPASQREAYSHAIVARLCALNVVRAAQRCFVFISSGSEVHTHGLIRWLLRGGRDVAVPKILGQRQMIACRLREWSGLTPAQLGILTPLATEPVEEAFDIVITPGLGFTPRGDRLGFGAAYYDRWFAAHTVRFKIAVAFEAQIMPVIPVTTTDVPVDAIVTEQRMIAVNSAVQ
ncbi:MAG: 5-formyltetrahydrofolate cyclo-ligase [Chromatiales bacterium]